MWKSNVLSFFFHGIFGPPSSVCLLCWCSSDLHYVLDVFKPPCLKCNSLENCLQIYVSSCPKLCYLWFCHHRSLYFFIFLFFWWLATSVKLSFSQFWIVGSMDYRDYHSYYFLAHMRTKAQDVLGSNTCAHCIMCNSF